jgi:hypothetical protein
MMSATLAYEVFGPPTLEECRRIRKIKFGEEQFEPAPGFGIRRFLEGLLEARYGGSPGLSKMSHGRIAIFRPVAGQLFDPRVDRRSCPIPRRILSLLARSRRPGYQEGSAEKGRLAEGPD